MYEVESIGGEGDYIPPTHSHRHGSTPDFYTVLLTPYACVCNRTTIHSQGINRSVFVLQQILRTKNACFCKKITTLVSQIDGDDWMTENNILIS